MNTICREESGQSSEHAKVHPKQLKDSCHVLGYRIPSDAKTHGEPGTSGAMSILKILIPTYRIFLLPQLMR